MTEVAGPLERGQAAFARGAFQEARDCFEEALGVEESAEAYEGLSWAAFGVGEYDLMLRAREEAFRRYRLKQDDGGAARMAIWLSQEYVDFRGELSIANGWRQRARRLLSELPTAPEHGWLAVVEGDAALCYDDDSVTALNCARQASAIGRDLKQAELELMGLAMEGIASVTQGEVDAGMKCLDEAAATALSGEIEDPVVISWALCYLIFACERVRDFNRAEQWCEKLREYADRFQLSQVQGICRVHYAGILIWRGQWLEAESQLAGVRETVSFSRLLVSESIVRLAELRRRQGRLEEARGLFQEAEWHPLALIGMAELDLEAGRPRDAAELVDRALRQVPETSRTQRSAAFELKARVEALLGNHAAAGEAVEAVRALSETVPTFPLRAAASYSAGALAIGARDFDTARAHLEDAVDLYERSGAPYESARARLDLASVFVMLDRPERAQVQAGAALQTLNKLGSLLYAGRAKGLLEDIQRRLGASAAAPQDDPAALTERQVEILSLVASGLNDREIAAKLVVSEHTVHRHIANILQRLALPSRAAAVAYASNRGLLNSP